MEHLRHFLQHVGGSLLTLSHLSCSEHKKRLLAERVTAGTIGTLSHKSLVLLMNGPSCVAVPRPAVRAGVPGALWDGRGAGDSSDITREGSESLLQWEQPNGQMMDDSFSLPTWLPFIHVYHHLLSSKSLTWLPIFRKQQKGSQLVVFCGLCALFF